MTSPWRQWGLPEGRDLFSDPLWRAEDLGKPIPESPNACSVALPLWSHAIGYEEQDPAVIGRMQCGYPRFFFHPQVSELMSQAAALFAGPGQVCFVFPSRRAADRCADYVKTKHGAAAHVEAFGRCEIHLVICPNDCSDTCKAFWQHTGLVVSSRHARCALGDGQVDEAEGRAARQALCQRIAGQYAVAPTDVLLFPSGMAAIFEANRLATGLHPGRRRVHLEFPFLDTLKVQQEFAGEVALYTSATQDCDEIVGKIRDGDPVGAVVTEVPSNPLLKTIDFERIAPVVRDQGALMIVDDTVGTPVNVDVMGYADIVVVSLTKYFCGHGDVFAGAMVLSPASPHYAALSNAAHADYEALLWGPDAAVLERRSRDFEARVRRISEGAEVLAQFLQGHPAVERVYYPKFDTDGGYEALRVAKGGYGGVISILLRDAPRTSEDFYDRLRVNKGPSLGANYTLVCPYTLLAHYRELDWAESHGASRWLLRISVGMEDVDDLKNRFEEALARLK